MAELSFIKKVVAIQAELKAPKDKENKFGGYKYRTCEGILEAAKPLLTKYELLLVVSDEIVEIAGRVYVKATATLIDSSGETVNSVAYAREPESKKGMDDSQLTGSTSSYARKYALNGLLAIDDNKDADTNEVANLAASAEKSAARTKKAPAPAKDTCAVCGKVITARGKYSADEIIEKSTAKLGQPTCYDCWTKQYAEAQKKAQEG